MSTSEIRWVADTNVCNHLLRGWPPAVEWWQQNLDQTALTDVVALELLRGTVSKDKLRTTEAFLASFPILKTNPQHIEAAALCYKTWDRRRSQRTPALPDMMVAQVAISHDLPLISFNKKDFEHIPGLTLISDAYRNTG